MFNMGKPLPKIWEVCIHYEHKMPSEERKLLKRARQDTLRKLGYKISYDFPFDKKADAEALAKKITEATGVPMDVLECSPL